MITIKTYEDAKAFADQYAASGEAPQRNYEALTGSIRWADDPGTQADDIERYKQEAIRWANTLAATYNEGYQAELDKLSEQAANLANSTDVSGLPEDEAQALLANQGIIDQQTAYQDAVNAFNTKYGSFGFDPYQDPVLQPDANGYIQQIGPDGQPVSAAVGGDEANLNTSNVGEGTTIRQNADGQYEVVGVQSGQVFGSYDSLALAQAGQNQTTLGSTPTLTGAPGLYALEPTQAEKEQGFGQAFAPYVDPETGLTITPQVATPEQLAAATAGQPVPNLNTPVQIRNVDELNRYAGLGLTESDITRQGSAIYLNPGVNEEMLRQRGPAGTQVGSDMITAGTGSQVPVTPGGQSTVPQMDQAAARIATFDQVAGTNLSAEGQLLGTLGQGIIDQEKALRELPESIRERTENVGVTQGQLNRLIATEREPIAQALKDLLLSRSLLQEQIAFGREERAYQAQQLDNGYQRILASGMSSDQIPDEYFAQLDSFNGVPAGTHESMYNAERASSLAAQQAAQLDVASKVVGIMNDLPVGQSFTIGNQTYTGLNTGNLKVGTEEDANGNVTLWQYDPLSGQYSSRDLGNIGKASGWETIMSNEGGIYAVNPNSGQMQLIYPGSNTPGGGNIEPTGGLFDAFPEGSITPFSRSAERGGQWMAAQCGAFVNDLTGIGFGDSYSQKMSLTDSAINASNAQIGDVFVQPYGSTGHVGIINGVNTAPDGTKIFTVTESNWEKNADGVGLVTHTRQVRADQISGFARPGFKDPSWNFGTDAGNISGPTFGSQGEPLSSEDRLAIKMDIQKDDRIANYGDLANSYNAMQSVFDSWQSGSMSSPASVDQALVTLFNKMLDPGSVVKEGEYARSAQGQSVISQAEGFLTRLQSGGAGITDETRQDMVDVAETLLGAAGQTYGEAVNEYSSFIPAGDNPAIYFPGYTTYQDLPKNYTTVNQLIADFPQDATNIQAAISKGYTLNQIAEILSE